jgi:hypothetical protein
MAKNQTEIAWNCRGGESGTVAQSRRQSECRLRLKITYHCTNIGMTTWM